eukprot:GHVU01029548.1.p2 GENE.GHVU01029548.1~~GHVU01029548.1.p2  ORF type:complete len:117 (-),score=3.76 GHVU01029548.1:761-1111(-)
MHSPDPTTTGCRSPFSLPFACGRVGAASVLSLTNRRSLNFADYFSLARSLAHSFTHHPTVANAHANEPSFALFLPKPSKWIPTVVIIRIIIFIKIKEAISPAARLVSRGPPSVIPI